MRAAKKIATTSTDLSGVSDALQLGLCNVTLDHVDQPMAAYPVPTTGHVVYVDPTKGSDSAAGTIDAPLATIVSSGWTLIINRAIFQICGLPFVLTVLFCLLNSRMLRCRMC